MPQRPGGFGHSVFVNCPFDRQYYPLFEALVFTVLACGLHPRCALEELDSGAVRLEKIQRIIRSCRFAIHDLSRVELSGPRSLPRFNMPFELGLDIGCRIYGDHRARQKRVLILDARRYRYQAFISDISGQDVHTHGNAARQLIRRVRDWLRVHAPGHEVPGPLHVERSFRRFSRFLPENCRRNGLDRKSLLFADYVSLARIWIEAERNAAG